MTKGRKKNKKGKSKKYKKKSNKNNHTHKIISHKHNGNKKHSHRLNNSTIKKIYVYGDNNHIQSGGMDTKGPLGNRLNTPVPTRPKSSPMEPKNIAKNSNIISSSVKGERNTVTVKQFQGQPQEKGEPMDIGEEEDTEETRKEEMDIEGEELVFPPIPPQKEEETGKKEDHEFYNILEFIDFEYILSEKNIENIMDYISYCVYQWELYKDYIIPKDEYYQNMIDELYNDSLYTNNIDKDYDFIPDEKQSGGNNGDEKNKRPLSSTEGPPLDKTSEELPPPLKRPKSSITPDEKINIIKDIFSKNDNYHDFMKGTRAVYLQQPTPNNEIIKKRMETLLTPQNKTSLSSTSSIQSQSFNQANVLDKYSKILQDHPHSEGSVLKRTLSLERIDTKKTFSSYIKDDELEKFIDEMNKPENTDKKNSILTNYYVIPKISQKDENGGLALEDKYMYFIRKDENPKNNYKMLQNICKDMALTYTVCLGVFLNELVRESSTVYPITILDSLDYFKSYSNQFLKNIEDKINFSFLREIKTLAKKMDPIVRSPNQTVDDNLDDIYKQAYQLVLKYLFGIDNIIQDLSYNSQSVKIAFENNNEIDFYFATNTVEIVSEAIVSIINNNESTNENVKNIINTANQINNLQSTKDDTLVILTKLKTQGDLYQVITANLINQNQPISFYTEDRLCLSIAFMIHNFLGNSPLNVFFKASSGQYEDETDKENILMDTKMNKEVTVCSSEMLLTTKKDYILMCKNEISKVQQDFIKFRDRFITILGNDDNYTKIIIDMTTNTLEKLAKLDSGLPLNDDDVVNETEIILNIQNDSTDETDKETNSKEKMKVEDTSSEITPEDRKKIDIIRDQVANLHSLIAFNENISDTFLEYAFTRPSTGIINTIQKKVFKTNVPISKQFTHFGNFKVKSWMEWKQDNSGINKYLKENINSLKERKNKIEKALRESRKSTDFNGIFTQFLGELKTKSDALIQAFFNDFEKKITELKQPPQNKRSGLRVKEAKNQSKDTSTIENLSEEKEDINCNIAKLDEEKRNIIDKIKIDKIKNPIMNEINRKNTKLTQEQKDIILSKILGNIIKQKKLLKNEEKYIPKDILQTVDDLSDKLSSIKNTMKEFSKKLISCAKKILTEEKKIAEPNYVPEEVKNELKSYLESEKLSSFKEIFTKQASTPAPPSSSKGGKHKKSRKNRKRRTKLKNKNKKTKRKISKRSKRTTKKNKKSSKKYKITHKKKQYKD